jgi:predicted dehydrogenase
MRYNVTRRQWLRGAAGAGVLVIRAAARAGTAANDDLAIGLVGAGGRGCWFCDLLPRTRGMRLVALCDVDEHKARQSFDQFPDLPKFADFRVMLETMADRLDGVIVATPDNTHAVASAAALRAGKPVYTEKPLTLNVYESHVLRRLAREQKVATQTGNQGTSSRAFREALALVRGGALGEVRDAYVWIDGGGGGKPRVNRTDIPCPETLHWDLWLGPARARPYHPVWMRWHGWREFGSGGLGGWGSHSANLPFMALGGHTLWHADPASRPRLRFRAEASEADAERYPRWWVNHWEFPARDGLPPAAIHWVTQNSPAFADLKQKMLDAGVELNERNQPVYRGSHHTGCFIPGTKGAIVASSHNMTYRFLPAEKGAEPPQPPEVARSRGHENDWAAAIRGGPPAWSHYDYSGPLNEMLMLGNVSSQLPGEDLEYDPLACTVTNHAKADGLLRRQYREGWTL